MADRRLIYWDASALLSFLFEDEHTEEARMYLENGHFHLISTLAWTETLAVIARLQRQGILNSTLSRQATDTIKFGPWRRTIVSPRWNIVEELAKIWPLRGADLWHLATAKTLKEEFSELYLLTFDKRLGKAAKGEGTWKP